MVNSDKVHIKIIWHTKIIQKKTEEKGCGEKYTGTILVDNRRKRREKARKHDMKKP